MAKAIAAVYIFYTLDARHNETLLSFASSAGRAPMICTDERNLDTFRKIAQQKATEGGGEVVMKRFDVGAIAEVFTP